MKRQGMTILLTTHYMDEAFQICDRIIIMNRGEKILEGNPHALVNANIEPFVLEINSMVSFQKIKANIPAITRVDESADVIRIYSREQLTLETLTKNSNRGVLSSPIQS